MTICIKKAIKQSWDNLFYTQKNEKGKVLLLPCEHDDPMTRTLTYQYYMQDKMRRLFTHNQTFEIKEKGYFRWLKDKHYDFTNDLLNF